MCWVKNNFLEWKVSILSGGWGGAICLKMSDATHEKAICLKMSDATHEKAICLEMSDATHEKHLGGRGGIEPATFGNQSRVMYH